MFNMLEVWGAQNEIAAELDSDYDPPGGLHGKTDDLSRVRKIVESRELFVEHVNELVGKFEMLIAEIE